MDGWGYVNLGLENYIKLIIIDNEEKWVTDRPHWC